MALRYLESMGLVQRQGAARTQLVRLSFDNHLVKELVLPVLKKERELLGHAQREIAHVFRSKALAITLFGSVARGEDEPGSDVDVLIICESADRNGLLEKAENYAAEFHKKYGLQLSVIIMTPNDARKSLNSSKPLLKNILSDGIDLLPRRLQEVLK